MQTEKGSETKVFTEGYEKGYQDAVERAYQLIINYMPLCLNHQCDTVEFLEMRLEYARKVADRFKEKMIEKRK